MKNIIILFLALLTQHLMGQPIGPEVKWVVNLHNTYSAKFTSDDKYIVANDGGMLMVIDAESGSILRQRNLTETIYAIDLMDNDSIIVCAGSRNIVKFLNFYTLDTVKMIRNYEVSIGSINHFDITNDNKIIALNCSQRKVVIYDLENNKVIKEFTSNNPDYFKIKYCDNDNKLAIALSESVLILDTKTYSLVKDIGGGSRTTPVLDFDISSDETKLITCADDGKIMIWDLISGDKIDEYDIDIGIDLRAVKYLLDNQKIIYSGGGSIRTTVIDITNKKRLYRNEQLQSRGFEISHDNKYILLVEGGSYVLLDVDKILSVPGYDNPVDSIIYPNPGENIITIEIQISKPVQIEYSIYNETGINVKKGIKGITDTGISSLQFDISSLSDGIYFIELRYDNSIKRYKFIKGS